MQSKTNIDIRTVNGFGDEWVKFDQTNLTGDELKRIFDSYFSIFPWSKLPEHAVGFDLGCGTGRWAKLVLPRVGMLHCIDPSKALEVAKRNLAAESKTNVQFHLASVDAIPLADSSMDFGYSLGVLHHIPDTQAAIASCVNKLKPGAPFLVYLYYAFDNRPFWFRWLWNISNLARKIISKLPFALRYIISQMIAVFVYYPLAKISHFSEKIGFSVSNFPLSAYRKNSFYTMRTDALDRFGTHLEKRFTREQIKNMMIAAGLEAIEFSEKTPFWCAVGFRKSN